MTSTRSKSKYGQCRCCNAKGYHRDIVKEYDYNGQTEVYLDLFMDCFNYLLSTKETLTTLICTSCVSRLRDANSFRNMTVDNEKRLLGIMVDDCKFLHDNEPGEAEMSDYNDDEGEMKPGKVEIDNNDDSELTPEEAEISYLDVDDDDDDDDDEHKLTTVKIELSDHNDDDEVDVDKVSYVSSDINLRVSGEDELPYKSPADKPLPTRSTLKRTCPVFVKHLDDLKGQTITGKSLKKMVKRKKPKQKLMENGVTVPEKLGIITNACTLLENCNATVFKKKRMPGYPCFYCKKMFESMNILRVHQRKHAKRYLFKLLSRYTADSLVVYAEVTNLKCTICKEKIPSLNDLKSHLIEVHDKTIYTEFEDRVVPFKLNDVDDYDCQICGHSFANFANLEKHMNVHYSNIMCEECGASFVNMRRLKIHKYIHKEGIFHCGLCKKNFSSAKKFQMHNDVFHNQKNLKCSKCTKRFADYTTRQLHFLEEHANDLYKCTLCDHRGFMRKFNLSEHMIKVHSNGEKLNCSMCSYICATKSELRNHFVLKHLMDKSYKCSVCQMEYVREKALLDHMKTHEEDSKVLCQLCGERFLHQRTLTRHMNKQHRFS